MPIRRSRGYAPQPIALRRALARPVLACGAELKSTVCVAKGGHAVLSHHLGDLENREVLLAFTEATLGLGVVALLISYAGIAFVFVNDLQFGGDSRATLTGGALVFGSAFLYALYLVDAGAVIARLGSLRFIAWAMLVSCVFVLGHFALTRDVALLRVPPSIYALSLAMAVFSTVLPTWLIAEAVHRLGASTSSLIGSLGPVFTIGLGALILGETVQGIQLAGAALVLVGVMLVTLQPGKKRDAVATPVAEVPDT